MDLNIGLHTLKVGGVFVSRRRGGWVIELMPGMIWSRDDKWVLEPNEPGDEYEEACLFDLESAIHTAILVSAESEQPKNSDEDEDDDDEDLEEADEPQQCHRCKTEGIQNLSKISLELDFPIPMDNRLGDHLIGRASFTGPTSICKKCLLEFIDYYLTNHITSREKTLRENLNMIVDMIHNDEPMVGVEAKQVQKLLTTMARVYYPLLAWVQMAYDDEAESSD